MSDPLVCRRFFLLFVFSFSFFFASRIIIIIFFCCERDAQTERSHRATDWQLAWNVCVRARTAHTSCVWVCWAFVCDALRRCVCMRTYKNWECVCVNNFYFSFLLLSFLFFHFWVSVSLYYIVWYREFEMEIKELKRKHFSSVKKSQFFSILTVPVFLLTRSLWLCHIKSNHIYRS